MKLNLLFLLSVFFLYWTINSGFTPNEDSPSWNTDPRSRIDISPVGQYIDLPQGTNDNYSSETRIISTPQEFLP
ncbi:MAG: hypothetical protein R2942_10655 [Ignavibacteria bacterium]